MGTCMGKVYGKVSRANSAFLGMLGSVQGEFKYAMLVDDITMHSNKEELRDQNLPSIAHHCLP